MNRTKTGRFRTNPEKAWNSAKIPRGPNPNVSKVPQQVGPNPQAYTGREQYIGGLFKGTLSIIDARSR